MMPYEGEAMSFQYTEIGGLINKDKYDEASSKIVDLLVQHEVTAAAEGKRAIEARANKAAVARALGVDYRTVTRWVGLLRDKGLDVVKQAEAKLQKMQSQPATT